MIPKFRFYNLKLNKIYEVVSVDWINEQVDCILPEMNEDIANWDWNVGVLMRSTGLKDKNGADIFEGDVLEIPVAIDNETLNGEVVFEDGVFGIKDVLYGWGFEIGLVQLIEIILAKKVIIAGNKFEHPHLLEE